MKNLLFIFVIISTLGLLAQPVSAQTLSPQLCKDKVIEAAQLIQTEGQTAIEKIKDPSGPFRFAGGQGYVWIHTLDGKMIIHPKQPELEGQSVLLMKDSNDFYFYLAMNEVAEEKGTGWVAYTWPKSGEETSSPFAAFVKHVSKGGIEYVVGSGSFGMTANDIKRMFPSDPIYEE